MSSLPGAVDDRSTAALMAAYFTAGSQAEVDEIEAAIRARSSGRVEAYVAVCSTRGATDAWLGRLRAVPRGLRSSLLFGESDDERRERIGHVELATPIEHPCGAAQTRCVPVLPLTSRRPVSADGVLGEPAVDALYARLVRANLAMHHSNDQADVYAEARADMAVSMSGLVALIGRGPEAWTRWEQRASLPPVPVAPPLQRPPYDPASIWGFRIFDDGTGLVAYAKAAVVFRQRDGKILRVLDTGGAELLAAASPAVALFKAWAPTGRMHEHVPDVAEEVARVFAMNLRTGAWISRPAGPADPLPIWFEEAMETSRLHDHDGRMIELLIEDYPVVHEATSDHRFIWVEDKHGHGGVYRLRDGALVTCFETVEDEPSASHLDARGDMKATRRSAETREHPSAICRSPRGRWLTFREGVVAEDGRPFLTIGGRSKLAAFSSDGSALWVADGREVRCIELGASHASVKWRWPYPPLRIAAGAPARPRPVVI